MVIGGVEYLVEVKARIQDLGVICILFNIPPEEDISYKDYLNLVLAVEELPDEEFRKFVDATMETIGPACTNQNISGYDEDFVVYYFQDPIPADWDIPRGRAGQPVLLCRRRSLAGLGQRRSL